MKKLKYFRLLNPFYLYHEREYLHRRLAYKLARFGMPTSLNDIQLAALKDKHKGQRCFIIGAGPSLKVSDLDRLKKEITFASNKIYLAFDQTSWRPTYYTVVDMLVAQNNHQVIQQQNLSMIFDECIEKYFVKSKDVVWLKGLSHPVINGEYNFRFSTNALKGFYGGYTVIYTQMQLAFYMGIREIYIIGIDFKFNIPKPTGETCMHGQILDQNGGINHFHREYRKPGETWTIPRLDLQRKAFMMAKKTFEQYGGCIYNASRNTELDVFPIVDFDEVMP